MNYRLYGLVPYNLSDKQKGIQYAHALQEMNNQLNGWYGDKYINPHEMAKFQKWAVSDKTIIMLNGGTTNYSEHRMGTLNKHLKTLVEEFGVYVATFSEEDFGDQLAGVVFIVEDKIWDEEKYPSPNEEVKNAIFVNDRDPYKEAIDYMGGNENWEFRKFLKQFELA